jgi:hypothetical protein
MSGFDELMAWMGAMAAYGTKRTLTSAPECPLLEVKRTSQLKIPQYQPLTNPQETSPRL